VSTEGAGRRKLDVEGSDERSRRPHRFVDGQEHQTVRI
jgi:hypothetical protein